MNSVTAARSARSVQTTLSEKSNEPVSRVAVRTCGSWRIALSKALAVVVGRSLTSICASIVRPRAAGSTTARTPRITPAWVSLRTRSATALALRWTAAPMSVNERRPSFCRILRISQSILFMTRVCHAEFLSGRVFRRQMKRLQRHTGPAQRPAAPAFGPCKTRSKPICSPPICCPSCASARRGPTPTSPRCHAPTRRPCRSASSGRRRRPGTRTAGRIPAVVAHLEHALGPLDDD